MKENPSFLKEQIITYLGNKRALLSFLNNGFKVAKKELGKDKFSFCDIFSGSGVVSRFAKAHSNYILANDLEDYSKLINECYLANKDKDLLKNGGGGCRNFSNHPKVKSIFLGLHKLLLDVLHRV